MVSTPLPSRLLIRIGWCGVGGVTRISNIRDFHWYGLYSYGVLWDTVITGRQGVFQVNNQLECKTMTIIETVKAAGHAVSEAVLAALGLYSKQASTAEKSTLRIKGEKAKAQAAMYTVLAKEFGTNWHTLTKGMSSKGIKFASEVEQCRIALQSMQTAAKAGNPDSAWNELKRAYAASLATPEMTEGAADGKSDTRNEKRTKDQVFRDQLAAWIAECTRTSVKQSDQTLAQREGMQGARDLMKVIGDHIPASPKK